MFPLSSTFPALASPFWHICLSPHVEDRTCPCSCSSVSLPHYSSSLGSISSCRKAALLTRDQLSRVVIHPPGHRLSSRRTAISLIWHTFRMDGIPLATRPILLRRIGALMCAFFTSTNTSSTSSSQPGLLSGIPETYGHGPPCLERRHHGVQVVMSRLGVASHEQHVTSFLHVIDPFVVVGSNILHFSSV